MKRIKSRVGKGYEVQLYDDKGDASDVVQMDTAEELAQYLARACWGELRFSQNPTIWKDGEKWCCGEYTPVSEDRTCVVITHSFDAETTVYRYGSWEAAEAALQSLYDEYLGEEQANHSDLNLDACYCYKDEGYGEVTWSDNDRTYFTTARILDAK